jgi:hypothetical protein
MYSNIHIKVETVQFRKLTPTFLGKLLPLSTGQKGLKDTDSISFETWMAIYQIAWRHIPIYFNLTLIAVKTLNLI